MVSYKPLKRILFEREISQVNLCLGAGIGVSTLTRICKYGNPRDKTLQKIADYLGVEVKDLYEEVK